MSDNPSKNLKLFQFLSAVDVDLGVRAKLMGCVYCGGVLHSARYPRKPRGLPEESATTAPTMRQSFCCEQCRRRTTPPSVCFLGRRVYPGFLMVLLSAMRSGVTDSRMEELQSSVGATRRTLQRWRHWWREIFVQSPFWTIQQGLFMPPIEAVTLPKSLLERFLGGDACSRLVQCLKFLAPLSVPGAIRLGSGR